MKRNHDLAVAFAIAVTLHGLAVLVFGLFPDRSATDPATSMVVGPDGNPAEMREVEMWLPDSTADERDAESTERTAPVEERSVAVSESIIPDLPGSPLLESRMMPLESAPQATARVTARWVDLLPEVKPSSAAGTGFRTQVAKEAGAVRPELKGFTRPRYPIAARQRGEEGRVTLRVRVDVAGVARETRVTKSSGYGELDRTALAAAVKATFRPAQQGGVAVEAECELVFEFRLEDQ